MYEMLIITIYITIIFFKYLYFFNYKLNTDYFSYNSKIMNILKFNIDSQSFKN